MLPSDGICNTIIFVKKTKPFDTIYCPASPPVVNLFFDFWRTGSVELWNPAGAALNPVAPQTTIDSPVPVTLSHWDIDHRADAARGQLLHRSRGLKISWDSALHESALHGSRESAMPVKTF
ncbi:MULTISPECIES: hypothetical protein [Burkholderia]|uniref:hypothetical protein n=1 Tax=Burkholderia TaxID=32008 RepID=UPI001039DB5B|nr:MULTISPECIES: hypothetical protein [Burkholderia]